MLGIVTLSLLYTVTILPDTVTIINFVRNLSDLNEKIAINLSFTAI